MKIFFTAPYSGKTKYQKYYDLIIASLQRNGCPVISPELDPNYPLPSDSNHYSSIKKGITDSDAVVLEISHECFQLGHEATIAIQNKKHVLCLSLYEDFSLKIKHRYFHGAKYSELNLDDHITSFVSAIRHHQFDQRFNFFLSAQQLQKIELTSSRLGLTKSDYLRSLIDQS